MSALRSSSAVLILVGAAIGIYILGSRLDEYRYCGDVVEELMYFPSGRFLQLVSLGYDTLVADLLWFKGIQYYGEHRRSDRDYPLAEHIFWTVTDLDPQFLGAYRFGAFVLGQDAGQPGAGIELLRKGMRHNPGVWQLPFDLGFLYFIEIRDNARAAHFFRFASSMENAPELAKRFSAFAYRKAGRTSLARSLWEEVARSSDNKVVRETAERAIKSIQREEIAVRLTEQVTSFQQSYGRLPSDLLELVRVGMLAGLPSDPLGGRFVLDRQTGMVLSTSKVADDAERTKEYLEQLSARYFQRKGQYPRILSDLVEEGMLAELPHLAGTCLRYDPAQGTVEYHFIWDGD